MTRQEFIDNVKSFEGLVTFCGEVDLSDYLSIYHYGEMMDQLEEDVRSLNLEDIIRMLDSVQDANANWFFWDCSGRWISLTEDDFETHKYDILVYCDEVGYIWDEPNEFTTSMSFDTINPSKLCEINGDEFFKLIA